ncbi:MAG: monovalent cation/H(+) antiporter subunit G [Opitutaceae bacterium]|nr:monovalent cation/H(+) antiporter subunit G [Opitutaceae bacterium]
MNLYQEQISVGIMILGALLVLIAMIGIVRFPDVFCRAHALGKGLTLGLMILLFGIWLDPKTEVSGLKVIAAIFFQFVTLPVASHLIARLSYEKNLPRARRR